MKYIGWIDYPSFSFAVSQTANGYRCQKFAENVIVRGAAKVCSSTKEVKDFLSSFANPPIEQIDILIAKLELE